VDWLAFPAMIWLLIAAWQDFKKREVSNLLTIPPVLLVAGWWAWHGEWAVAGLLGAILLLSELPPAVGVPLGLITAGSLGIHAPYPVVLVLVTWACAWAGWTLHFFGAADAKVIMALVGLWPDVRLVGLLVAAHVLWSACHLLRRYWSRALQVALVNAVRPPTGEELESHGVIALPAYSAAGLLYFALAWGGGW
jgi:Flp pilus assembly protein protease CpaA